MFTNISPDYRSTDCNLAMLSLFMRHFCDPLEVSELLVPALCLTGDNGYVGSPSMLEKNVSLLPPHFA